MYNGAQRNTTVHLMENTAPIKSDHGSAAPTLGKQPFGLIGYGDSHIVRMKK